MRSHQRTYGKSFTVSCFSVHGFSFQLLPHFRLGAMEKVSCTGCRSHLLWLCNLPATTDCLQMPQPGGTSLQPEGRHLLGTSLAAPWLLLGCSLAAPVGNPKVGDIRCYPAPWLLHAWRLIWCFFNQLWNFLSNVMRDGKWKEGRKNSDYLSVSRDQKSSRKWRKTEGFLPAVVGAFVSKYAACCQLLFSQPANCQLSSYMQWTCVVAQTG